MAHICVCVYLAGIKGTSSSSDICLAFLSRFCFRIVNNRARCISLKLDNFPKFWKSLTALCQIEFFNYFTVLLFEEKLRKVFMKLIYAGYKN